MSDANYRKRLAADLPKWLDAGWVTADGATGILGSIPAGSRRAAFGFSAILGTLGALLLGLAVLAYVGAQWEEVPRLVRFALLALAMLVAYGAAFQFERRELRIFAEAGMLAGGLVYAGAIALVGQTYHLAGDFAGAVTLFEVGILGAALFTGSPTMNVLGLIGAGYWAWLATGENHIVPHWQSLAAIVIGVVVATVQNSHYGRIVAVIAFMYWVALTIFGFGDAHDWSFAAGMGVYATAALAIWGFGAALVAVGPGPRIAALGDAILWPGLFAILVTLGVVQLVDKPLRLGDDVLLPVLIAGIAAAVFTGVAAFRRSVTMIDLAAVMLLAVAAIGFIYFLPDDDLVRKIIGGVIVIIGSLWAVSLGQGGTHPIGKSIGLVAFGLEVIYLYVFTIGTRLDTALAFLIGGVLFIVLSYVLFRIDRILGRRATAAAIVADIGVPPAPAQPIPVPELPAPLRTIDLPEPPAGDTEPKP